MRIFIACLVILFSSFFALAADAPADPVLVKWRNLTLTEQDYRAAVQAIPEKDRAEFSSDMKRVTAMLENMLLLRTLANEAVELSLDKDPLVQKEIVLAAQRILATKRMQSFEKEIKKPDFSAAALERYETKPAEFEVPEQIGASHILITTKSRSDEEALKRAEEIRQKALTGEEFANLAKEYSDDSTAGRNGGNLGVFPKGKMVKPFEDAAFALQKPGAISEVVKTQFGYHVIRLNSRVPARTRPFEEVKAVLIKELEDKYVNDEKAVYLSKIKNDKSIVMDTEAIERLTKPPKSNEASLPASEKFPGPGR